MRCSTLFCVSNYSIPEPHSRIDRQKRLSNVSALSLTALTVFVDYADMVSSKSTTTWNLENQISSQNNSLRHRFSVACSYGEQI